MSMSMSTTSKALPALTASTAWRLSLAMVIEQPDFCRNERATS